MIDDEPEDRQQEVLHAVLKFLGITVAIGVVIWIVSTLVVNSLDLNSTNVPVGGPGAVTSLTPLPTTALTPSPTATPTPTETPTPTDEPTFDPSDLPTSGSTGNVGDIELSLSPVFVAPMQRINLIGDWPGHDGVSLSVQRFEGGEWVDFGIQVQVKLGNFKTYVETSHEGDNIFRVYDPESGTASNQETVSVGN